jgi:hypothetical protein
MHGVPPNMFCWFGNLLGVESADILSDELAPSYVRTATLRSAGSDAALIDYILAQMSIKIWYLV